MKKVGLHRRGGGAEDEPITIHNLATPECVSILGSVAAVGLFRNRFIALHVDEEGTVRAVQSEAVQIDWALNSQLVQQRTQRVADTLEHLQETVEDYETRLDILDESQAIQELLEAGWDDAQMGAYLERRDLRAGRQPLAPPIAGPGAPHVPQQTILQQRRALEGAAAQAAHGPPSVVTHPTVGMPGEQQLYDGQPQQYAQSTPSCLPAGVPVQEIPYDQRPPLPAAPLEQFLQGTAQAADAVESIANGAPGDDPAYGPAPEGPAPAADFGLLQPGHDD